MENHVDSTTTVHILNAKQMSKKLNKQIRENQKQHRTLIERFQEKLHQMKTQKRK